MLKYQLAEQDLQRMIGSLGPGEPLPPVRRLIAESDFSQATLMKALSLLEARGLIERRRGAGIFTARVKEHPAGTVAVMLSTLDNSTSGQLLRGIMKAMARRSDQIVLLNSREYLSKVLPALTSGGIRQLIIYPNTPDLRNPEFLAMVEQLGELELRIATVAVPVPGLKCVFVGQENTHAFEEVALRLLKQGARSIAVTGNFNGIIYSSRLAGIRSAISRSGCASVTLKQIDEGDGDNASDIARQLLESRCDAVMLCNSVSSREIAYQLRILAGSRADHLRIAGVVEQGERMPLAHAVTLEKQSIDLGVAAVDALYGGKSTAKYLPMKIYYGNDPVGA